MIKTIIKYDEYKSELWIESASLNNTENVPTEFTDNKIIFIKDSDEIEPINMPIIAYEEAYEETNQEAYEETNEETNPHQTINQQEEVKPNEPVNEQ